jgi:hypothetical protein
MLEILLGHLWGHQAIGGPSTEINMLQLVLDEPESSRSVRIGKLNFLMNEKEIPSALLRKR